MPPRQVARSFLTESQIRPLFIKRIVGHADSRVEDWRGAS
jgi:hypothetical protein